MRHRPGSTAVRQNRRRNSKQEQDRDTVQGKNSSQKEQVQEQV